MSLEKIEIQQFLPPIMGIAQLTVEYIDCIFAEE